MDTLVSTEDGLRPIEEIQAGDYVWSENTETGKKELKKVLSVSVTETTTLVHVTTENGTVVDTTENHPFYVEGKGWCAAAELETGDVLRTEDGEQETVKGVQTEKLDKAVKVYNLEIEGSHTYYVSADSVLVHNACGDSRKLRNNMIYQDYAVPEYNNAAHHIVASSSKKAEPARNILKQVGIGINEAKNGVFLPRGEQGSAANHNKLHTNTYYETVNYLIVNAYKQGTNKKNEVENTLRSIANMLSNGTFEY